MTTDPTPPQQRGREWVGVGGRGERKEAGRKQHTRTHLKIYLHILCTRGANIWCLVVIGVYEAFVGFCFFCYLFLSFLLRSGETPRANSKGREVSALLTCQKSEVPLRMTNALLGSASPPVAAAPPRLPIETHYDLRGFFFSEGAMPRALLFPRLYFRQHTPRRILWDLGEEIGFVVEFSSLNRTSVATTPHWLFRIVTVKYTSTMLNLKYTKSPFCAV